MVGPFTLMSRVSTWGSNFLHVGALGLCLSVVFSEYTSQFLYAHYQTWSGWRSIIGTDPNSLTLIIQKLTWAFFFFSSWFMLWKLDCFFQNPTVKPTDVKENPKEEKVEKSTTPKENRKRRQKDHEEEEKILIETKDEIPKPKGESDEEAKKIIFSPEDYKYAKVLGLEEPLDLKLVKSTYRKIIAQYHPDRVVAMGPEIKDVAEKKAKEINEAYDHLRKKFDSK